MLIICRRNISYYYYILLLLLLININYDFIIIYTIIIFLIFNIMYILDQSVQNSTLGGRILVHGTGRSAHLLGQYSGSCNWTGVV